MILHIGGTYAVLSPLQKSKSIKISFLVYVIKKCYYQVEQNLICFEW